MEQKRREEILHTFLENPTFSGSKISKILKIPKSTVCSVLNRYNATLSINRKPRHVEKSKVRNPTVQRKVLASVQKNPGMSDRDRAKKCKTSRSNVQRIRVRNGLKAYRAIKYPNRTEKQESVAKTRARLLYTNILTKFKGCIMMDDETYVKCDFKQLPGNKFYIAKERGNVSAKYKYTKLDKYGKKFMIWQAICSCGLKSAAFVTSSKITSELYIKECLQKRVLPLIKKHNNSVKFWPDLATCHYSKLANNWYKDKGVDVIPKHMNPPNCPQFRPIERYWANVKNKLKKSNKEAKNEVIMLQKWNQSAKKVKPKDVQKLMGSINKHVRSFIRNEEN